MHRISRRMVAVVVLIGAIAAGGAAFTASNSIPDTVAGFGTSTISGAHATALSYVYDTAGANITDENLVFSTNISGDTVKAQFNGAALTDCDAPVLDTDGTSYDVACHVSVATDQATAFNVLVTKDGSQS